MREMIAKALASVFEDIHQGDGPTPYAVVDDPRNAVLDGHFDLVVIAQALIDKLQAEAAAPDGTCKIKNLIALLLSHDAEEEVDLTTDLPHGGHACGAAPGEPLPSFLFIAVRHGESPKVDSPSEKEC